MFNARTPVSGFRAIQWLRRVALLAVAPLAIVVHANAYAATVLPLIVPAYFDPVGKCAGYWNDLATTARPAKSGWERSRPLSRIAMRIPRPW